MSRSRGLHAVTRPWMSARSYAVVSRLGEAARQLAGLRAAARRLAGRWPLPTPRRSISAGIVLVLVASVAVLAYLADEAPVAKISLHDGGVWVTNRAESALGRFNRPIEQLDSRVVASAEARPDIDVVQSAEAVFAHDRGAGLLRRVDVARTELGPDELELPPGARVALGGHVTAVLDATSGKLWYRDADEVLALDLDKDAPDAVVGGEAALAVGVDGSVHAVSAADDRGVTVTATDRSRGHAPTVREWRLGTDLTNVQIAAVGDQPVVLGDGGRLVLPGGRLTTLTDQTGGLALQQSGPAADTVLVGTDSALLSIGIQSGTVATVVDGGTGLAAMPVRLGRCVHAAWSGRPTYSRRCGEAPAESSPLPDTPSGATLMFRVNRDAVILNEVAVGAVYVFERRGTNLGDWDAVKPTVRPDDPDDAHPRRRNRDEHNRPPVARPDTLGARAGQSATLYVLDNDGDADSDILVLRSVTAVAGEAGRLAVVHNGQAIQFTAATGWASPVQFKYTVDDGRGGTATAAVTVTPRPPGQNTLPVPVSRLAVGMSVELGGTASYGVLREWRDADGDPLSLVGASVPAPDTVRFLPDGQLSYVDAGVRAGRKTISVQVSDGIGAPVAGTVVLDVLGREVDGPPVANDDRVTAVAGVPVTIKPLDNDTDPNVRVPGRDARLRLTNVLAVPAGTTATPDYLASTVTFMAARPQAYYLRYEITDGARTASGRIRIDVRAPSSANPPIAVSDRVALRGGGPAEIDVLANDIDSDGDVLAVRSVEVPPGTGLTVSVKGHRWLRIVAEQAGSGNVPVRYTVSDGTGTDTGVVEVTRFAAADDNQPPTPADDQVSVRAGDVVTVDVLANDSDPDGSRLTLDPSVVPDSPRGAWLVADRSVRFQAPQAPGTATATYTVRDPDGRSAVARVVATVVAVGGTANQPPQPPTITARVFAGSVVRIPLPLSNVDPDGDSVALLGPARAPKLGRIAQQGADYLDYEAYPGAAGTDELTYRLADPFGARGTGTIRVGVVHRPERNSAPSAVDDAYVVAPGATVRVPVLANDSDIDGDPLTVEPLGPLNPGGTAGARLEGDRLVLTAGRDNETVTLLYGVGDGRGQRATAAVTVTARRGANLAPVARDDLVPTVPGNATSIDVDVLANDEDLDGTRADLKVEAVDGPGPAVEVTAARTLRVPLASAAREVLYRVTDKQGGSALAFVRVPAGGDQPPVRGPDAPVIEVRSGGDVVVQVAAQVVDPEGAPVRITNVAAMSASPVPGLSIVEGSVSPAAFTLRAGQGVSGPATVVLEVSDGATDGAGRTAAVTLPVTIRPPDSAIPEVSCPTAEPAAGGPPVTVDLGTCVTGVTPGARQGMRYTTPTGAPTGLTLARNGAVLTVRADAKALTGQPARLPFTVTDTNGHDIAAVLPVHVQPAGLAVATTDVVNDARAGARVRVDVTANDINPFPGQPLTVVAVRTVTGAANGTVDGDARHVVVQIDAGFHGRAVLGYRVQDATGEAARAADGQVVVNVVGRPAAPSAPVQRSVGDATAVLSWAEPAGNGARITRYEVSGGGFSQLCASTVCALRGLRNGQRYEFRVRAENAAGWSEWSPPSAPVAPDVQPDQPAPPTTRFGDRSITVSWTAPASRGSPVERYQVEISPAVSGPRTVSGTTLAWDGLANGASYTFRVRAYNAAANPSDWSGFSAPETPAGVPLAPDAPSATGVNDGIGEQMVVRWAPPATNGAPVIAYTVSMLQGGGLVRTVRVDGDATQATVAVTNGVDYTFRVTATNKAGESLPSAPSAPTRAHGAPLPVTSFSVSDANGATGYDRRVYFVVSPPDDNGMPISRYEWNYSGGTATEYASGASTGFIDGLTNGQTYTVAVRACNDQCGQWSARSAPVVPYGPVGTPGAGAAKSGSRQVVLSWSPPAPNGRPISRLEISINGGGWENVGPSAGQRVVGDGPNQSYTVQVRAFDSAGQVSGVAGASASTDPPAVLLSKGASAMGRPGCSSSACRYIVVELRNFPSGASVTCTFNSREGSVGFVTWTRSTDGAGNRAPESSGNYYGYPGGWVEATCNGVTSRMTW